MNIILTTLLGVVIGLIACLQFGLVQQRIIRSVLHTKGLDSTSVALGGSLPDLLFAGVGLIIIDQIFTIETALLMSFSFLVAAGLFGMGIYNSVLRPYSPKMYGSSSGSYESIGTGFGLGLFNFGHLFYWVLVMFFLRSLDLMQLSLQAQLGWVFGSWVGVFAGYMYTIKWATNKPIADVMRTTTTLGRVFGAVLVLIAIILGRVLLD